MIGLTYIDNLVLTRWQWAAILIMPLVPTEYQYFFSPLLFLSFYGAKIGKDQGILWRECRQLSHLSWAQFIDKYHTRRYVYLQNPFIIFAFSRLPYYTIWQLIFMGLLSDGYRMTPLSALMMTQPSPDLIAFLLMRLSCRLSQRMTLLASVLYGGACITKSTVIILLPIMAYKLRGFVILSILIVLLYWMIFGRTRAGKAQLEFLLSMIYVKNFDMKPFKTIRNRKYGIKGRLKKYRWTESLSSLSFYLFPAYFSFTFSQFFIFFTLSVVAPNVKYFLLILSMR